MNDVVERVARGMRIRLALEVGSDGRDIPVWLDNAFEPMARAAMVAMREPTEAMLLAAHDGPLLAMDHEMGIEQRKWLTEMWSAMLSAALADASPDIGKEGIGNDVR